METKIPAISELEEWGKLAKHAGILPPNLSIMQAACLVQAGREMGIPPLQALRSFYLVNGRIGMSAQLQLAMARRAGVRVVRIEENETHCLVELSRGEERVCGSFSIEEAKRAGLFRSGSNWEKYPRQMLRARAIVDALRVIAPDVVLGLYTPDEAMEVMEEPIPPAEPAEILDAEPVEVADVANVAEEPIPPAEPAEILDAEPVEPVEDEQTRRRLYATLHSLAAGLGWSKDQYRAWLQQQMNVVSAKELSLSGLRTAILSLVDVVYAEAAQALEEIYGGAWSTPPFPEQFVRLLWRLGIRQPVQLIGTFEFAADLLYWLLEHIPAEVLEDGIQEEQIQPREALTPDDVVTVVLYALQKVPRSPVEGAIRKVKVMMQ